MSIISIGKDTNYQDYLNRKIELSNQIALILVFGVALPFVLISYIYFKPLIIIPTVGILTCFLTIGFNYLRWHVLARMVVCLLPITLANLFGGYLAKSGELLVSSVSMLSLSFSFIIFLVIDIREKKFLIIMGVLMLAMILSLHWFNEVFETDLETEVIETGYLSYVTMCLSLLVGGSCILLVVFQNMAAGEKTATLLAESEQNHQMMIEKEKELKDNIVALEASKKVERLRQWSSEGLTHAIGMIREMDDSQLRYDTMISFIVKKIDAIQGSLFFLNDDSLEDRYLEQVATYAYDRKKYIDRKIKPGEGLVGQVYLEKAHLLLGQIPNGYVNITSGLGGAEPSYLLVMPMMINSEVYGILELASFKDIEEHKIEFLQSLTEYIASAFRNDQVNAKTKRLLENSQMQAEALKAQEEEMRQNQEELHTVQEQLNRQKKNLEDEIVELKGRLKNYES